MPPGRATMPPGTAKGHPRRGRHCTGRDGLSVSVVAACAVRREAVTRTRTRAGTGLGDIAVAEIGPTGPRLPAKGT